MGIFQSIKKSLGLDKYSLYRSLESVSFNKTSQSDFLDYNEISLYLNKAIEVRAEKVSEVQFRLMRGEKVIEDDKWLDLLNRPNKFHTGKQFWKLYQKYLDLTGNAFIFLETKNELFSKNEVPTAMHLLRPDMVKINFNEERTDIVSFEYNNGKQAFQYTKDQIIYAFNPDPKNPLVGMSLVKAGVRAIETGVQLDEYQAKILKNGGRIEGVFKFKNNLTSEQLKGLKNNYSEEYAGSQKAGIPLFLGGDADYMNVGLNPTELAYLESKKMSLEDIAILTGVPTAVLGTMRDVKFDNADASIKIFLREKIKPALQELTTILDWAIIPKDLDLEFVDPTPENIDETIKRVKTAHEVNSATINEMREMLGLEASTIPGSDDILIPFNLSPLGQEPPEPVKPVNDKEEKNVKNFKHPLRDGEFRKKYGQMKVKRMDKREAQFLKIIRNYFDEQKVRLLDYLPTKGFKKKGFVDELWNERREVQIARLSVIPLIKEILIEAGKESFDLTDSKYSFNYTSQMAKWIDDRADLFAEIINETTYNKLKNAFQESFEADESRLQLVKRIEEVYSGFDEARARTIARTEVHGATVEGTFQGYKQAGVKTKIWVSVIDSVTRDNHASVDGEEVPIDAYFSNGLFQPGDGDASDAINCRCQI